MECSAIDNLPPVPRANTGNLLNYRSSPFETWSFLSTNGSNGNANGSNNTDSFPMAQNQAGGLLNSLLTFPSTPVTTVSQPQSFNFQQPMNPYESSGNGNGNGKNFFNYLNSFPSIMGLNGNPMQSGYPNMPGSTGIRNAAGQ